MPRTVNARWHTCLRTPTTVAVALAMWLTALAVDPVRVRADDVVSVFDPAWMSLYVRDRRQTYAIETAQELARKQQVPETIQQLQYILSQPRDAWTLLPTGQVASVRRLSLELLDDPAAPLLGTYRDTVGQDAKLELARARDSGEAIEYLGVVRRYFPTAEAYAASEWLVKHWLDDGDWPRAASLSLRVIQSPSHKRSLTPRFLRMAALACEFAGWIPESEGLREQLSRVASVQAGTQTNVEVPPDWRDRLLKALPANAAPSPPVLEPVWIVPLESSGAYPQIHRFLEDWAGSQKEHDESAAVGWVPVLLDNQLIFRDLDTIRAIDTATGATVWRQGTDAGMGQLLSPTSADGSQKRYVPHMQQAAAANSLVSGLSTDGQRVYAVDDTEALIMAAIYGLDSQRMPQFSRHAVARNRLIAIDLKAGDHRRRLLWSTSDSPDKDRFDGHAFLGPPLAVSGVVYAISEDDRQVCVSALQATTGRLIWQQPVAEAERSVVEERDRSTRGCTPIMVRDLIVCPTHVGLLVAVDAVTGELRWAHNSLDAPPDPLAQRQRFRALPNLTQRHPAAFPCTPICVDDSLVYLPSQSDHLYCLDLLTGKQRWVVENVEADFVATVRDRRVVVIGKAGARAYALEDRKLLWTCPLSVGVSGYGVDVAGGYLVPLDSGHVVNIDLETGRPQGFRFEAVAQPMGHLIATSDKIYSVGIHGVAAFPQTHAALARLTQAAPVADPLRTSLKIAELHLADGNLKAAVAALEPAWMGLPNGADRDRAKRLLWETYFQLIREVPELADDWLARLERLAVKSAPREEARWLVAATARAQVAENNDRLNDLIPKLAARSAVADVFECPTDRDLEVSVAAWLRIVLDNTQDSELRSQLTENLLNHAFTDPAAAVARAVERILDGEGVDRLRFAQASSDLESRNFQQAAILLQRNLRSPSRDVRAEGNLALARLYRDAELLTAARLALARYQQELGVPAGELQPKQLLGADVSAENAIAAWQRAQPVDWPIRAVRIHSRPRPYYNVGDVGTQRDQMRVYELQEDYQRSISAAQPDSPVEWMMRNTERGTEIAAFDKLSTRKLFEHVFPFGAGHAGSPVDRSLESLIPFSLPGELRALSPLQGTSDYVAWSLRLPEWVHRSGQAMCGPSTSDVALFQWKNVLLAVDPADGHLLWRRNDLEPSGGMYADTRVGMLADRNSVFVMGSDKTSYRILAARTGQVVRRGTLEQDIRFTRFDVGGTILHITDEGTERFIRLWDPSSDQLLLNDPLRSRQLFWRFSDDSVAWLTPDARLRGYSVSERNLVFDVPLNPDDLASTSSLRVFLQNGMYFASLGRNQPVASTTHFHMPLQDKLIAETPMRDELLAIGPDGAGIVWRKSIPQRSFVQLSGMPAPFLVAAALVRDKRDPNRRWLRVEALDPETGVLLGVADELPNDRLLYTDFDAQQGLIRLIGRSTEIELDFSPAAQPATRDDGPL